ncbi:hypothetical protein TNCV_275481 [Trichonephila clavipes]|nr:hypothetical protein TNCV_275481 [Trichonephila clavipes]
MSETLRDDILCPNKELLSNIAQSELELKGAGIFGPFKRLYEDPPCSYVNLCNEPCKSTCRLFTFSSAALLYQCLGRNNQRLPTQITTWKYTLCFCRSSC